MPNPPLILPPVRVHQCLFGYSDGHRLLASSLQLDDNEITKLLPLSDLAPNLDTSGIEGYWTGIPLTNFKHYALMYTWPAPEMPRPGCVWTQTLLISFVDIGRFVDLRVLCERFVRPVINSQYSDYARSVTFTSDVLDSSNLSTADPSDGKRVLRALYGTRAKTNVSSTESTSDDVVFAIWSQQWPQFRRSFAFRTASSPFDASSLDEEFDLQLSLSPFKDINTGAQIVASTPVAWEDVAFGDWKQNQPTDLRRFLWRYGSDIRRPRLAFRFLVEFFLFTRSTSLTRKELHSVLTRLSKLFPSATSAKVLKDDLISCGFSKYSLLPKADVIDLLTILVQHTDLHGLTFPTARVFDELNHLWPYRAKEVLLLADAAVKSHSKIGEEILSRIPNILAPADLLLSTKDYPVLRFHYVSLDPTLLNSPGLNELPIQDIVELIREIPLGIPLAQVLINRLVEIDSEVLSQSVFAKFPTITLQKTAAAIDYGANHYCIKASKSWSSLLPEHIRLFFIHNLLNVSSSTRTLSAFLDLFGATNKELWNIGPIPWANSLPNAIDNVEGYQKQQLYTFLLSIALSNPSADCVLLFEKTFEFIHDQLYYSKLSSELLSLLLPNLPEQHWWNDWDLCQRLRLAIVKAYVVSDLSAKSFQRLTHNRNLMDQLYRLLSQSKRGRRFLRKVS